MADQAEPEGNAPVTTAGALTEDRLQTATPTSRHLGLRIVSATERDEEGGTMATTMTSLRGDPAVPVAGGTRLANGGRGIGTAGGVAEDARRAREGKVAMVRGAQL